MLGNSASFEDSFTTCQITPENHGSLLDSLFNMQLASRNPFSGQSVADWVFFARFTDPPPSTCTLTFARSCAELSGLGVWLSQSLTFGNLAAAFGACFLRLQKGPLGSDSGRGKDVLQDHGVWLSRSLTFGSSAATNHCPKAPPHRVTEQNQTEILRCPSPAGPRAAVGGSPLHNDYPTFAKLSRIKTLLSRTRKKFRAGSQHNMNGLRN